MTPGSDLTHDPWKIDSGEIPDAELIEQRARFLLRFAILAPSSHNSQPWAFRIEDDRIEVRIDDSRWLRVADPDMRELHLSLGCALENLIVAARYFGHEPRVEQAPEPGNAVVARVELGPTVGTARANAPLFDAIVRRRTSHEAFTARPLSAELVDEFRWTAEELGVRLVVVDDDERDHLAQLQFEADQRQMENEDYRRELGEWIGSGALGDSWPKARIARWVVTHFDLGEREGQDNARHIRRAPHVGVLTTPTDGLSARLRAGRAYERIALLATTRGVATHPLSQILEVPESKDRLGDVLSLGTDMPQHLFRAGWADEAGDHTPRWPLSTFLAD